MKRKDIKVGGFYVTSRGQHVVVVSVLQSGVGEWFWTCYIIYPLSIVGTSYRRTSDPSIVVRSSGIDCTVETYVRRRAHRERLVEARQRKLDACTNLSQQVNGVLQGLIEQSANGSTTYLHTVTRHGNIVVTMSPHAVNCLMHTIEKLKKASKQ